jgi:UDP:flavonoid glycosyltransferase YjiC (YdhE family)
MLPLGRDQHMNADRVARLGAASTSHATRPQKQIGRELDHLTAAPGFRNAAAAAAARIAADEPDRSAIQAIEGHREGP